MVCYNNDGSSLTTIVTDYYLLEGVKGGAVVINCGVALAA